jgi:hypothetical protein
MSIRRRRRRYSEGEKLSDSNKSFCYLGSTEARRLKLVEFGGRPAFYYTDYKDIAPVKSAYDEYMKLKRLQFEFLNSHEEIAPSVFLSKYSDGTEMLCNYTDKPFKYRYKVVEHEEQTHDSPAVIIADVPDYVNLPDELCSKFNLPRRCNVLGVCMLEWNGQPCTHYKLAAMIGDKRLWVAKADQFYWHTRPET